MTIDEYIRSNYGDNPYWFVEECEAPYHLVRIANVRANKDYLEGQHAILGRENTVYKGKVLETKKTVLNYAKTILKFHADYLLGNAVDLSGDEVTVDLFNEIYKNGDYESIDFNILDRVNKFGDAYEVVYYDEGEIKSKLLDSGDCNPVHDDYGNYLALIETWTNARSNITYWNVHYDGYTEMYDNEGAQMNMRATVMNNGLPIHYHNVNDSDYLFGQDLLKDMKPVLDCIEDTISKLGDSIYIYSLNPLMVSAGQRIENTMDADAVGYCLNLEMGSDVKMLTTEIDYNTIKLYLDNLKTFLTDTAMFPSVLANNTNVANVSEVSISLLFKLAEAMAKNNMKWLNIGFKERFKQFKKILSLVGVSNLGEVRVDYNLSTPVASNELVGNLVALKGAGLISTESALEKVPYVADVEVEKVRINTEVPEVVEEPKTEENSDNTVNE